MSQFTLIQKRAIFSVVAAVGVHVFVFGFWILLIIWDLPLFAMESPEKEPDPEAEVILRMRPFVAQSLPPPPMELPTPVPEQPADQPPQPKPEILPVAAQPTPPTPPSPVPVVEKTPEERKTLPEQKQKFARTSADQKGTPDAPTDVLGERDTRAASEMPPTPGANPNTPSQDGAAPLHPGHVETINKTYQDGSVGMDKKGEETEAPQEASARKDNTLIDDAPKVESTKPDESSSPKPKNKHVAEGRMLPTTEGGQGKKDIDDDLKAEEAPKERPNKGATKEGKGEETEQDPKKDGFQGHVKKTKVTGSISRKGKSAINVKNSPLGRYQASVSKAVELQWRRNCEQHRDHIVPGVISLRFYVDKSGKVTGIKFQEVIGANYIERGFTQRAIRQAKLPEMPKSVLKELKGEPLELIYNFYF